MSKKPGREIKVVQIRGKKSEKPKKGPPVPPSGLRSIVPGEASVQSHPIPKRSLPVELEQPFFEWWWSVVFVLIIIALSLTFILVLNFCRVF